MSDEPWANYEEVRKRQRSLEAENERLTAALKKIVDEADSDDGLTAWDGADIAREALSASKRERRD